MTRTTTRLETVAPWAAGLLLALPVLVAFYPPMTDLPFHEAEVSILRHLHDAQRFPEGLYVLNLGQPNQLFHMLGWGLAYPFGSRWAVKLVVAATVVAIPVCAARFARHVGASPLAALLVTPMTLGWLFTWGLIANLLGLAALLALYPVLDALAEEPTQRRLAGVLGGVVLLYFAHETAMFVYAGAALLFALLHPIRLRAWKDTALRVAPFGFAVVLTVAQAAWQKPLMSPSTRAVPTMWDSVVHKIVRVPYIILPATETPVELGMLALCLMAIGSLFWLRARQRKAAAAPATGPAAGDVPAGRVARVQAWGLRYRYEILTAGLMVGYLAFPLTLNSATLVYQRWFPPAFATLVVVAAPRDLSIPAARMTRLVALALPAATLLVVWPSFADSSRSYQELDQLIPLIQPDSAVAELELGPGDPTRVFSMGPSAGRVLATRGGRLAFAFTDSPVSPVIIPKEYRWNESLRRLGFDCWAFRPEHDFRSFRYALVRTANPSIAALAQIALEPEARYVATAGEWVLFESKLEVIPPMSPPLKLPRPPPEQLRERAAQIVNRLREQEGIPIPPEEEIAPFAPNGRRF